MKALPRASILSFPAALLLGAALSPSPAQACSYPIVVMEASYPERDAVDVPTNAVLFAYGSELGSGDEVILLDAQGSIVPLEVRPVTPSGFDLVPLRELEPSSRYLLRAVGPDDTSAVLFTTGSGPAALPAQLEAPSVAVLAIDYSMGTCGEQTAICTGLSHPAGTTLEVRTGDGVLQRPLSTSPWSRFYGGQLGADDCVEVRVRDVRGNRSEPAHVCGEAIERVRVEGDPPGCRDYTISTEPDASRQGNGQVVAAAPGNTEPELDDPLPDAAPPGARSGGCSVNQRSAGGLGAGGLLLGMTALLTALRRRRAG